MITYCISRATAAVLRVVKGLAGVQGTTPSLCLGVSSGQSVPSRSTHY